MVKDEDTSVPPEEEELFREFEAYVRSVYTAATSGAVQKLEASTDELRTEIGELRTTVSQSRKDYANLFAPAIARMEEAIKTMVQNHLEQSHRAVQSALQEFTHASNEQQAEMRKRFDLLVSQIEGVRCESSEHESKTQERSHRTLDEIETLRTLQRKTVTFLGTVGVLSFLGVATLLAILLTR